MKEAECAECKMRLPAEAFSKTQRGKASGQWRCKSCLTKGSRQRRVGSRGGSTAGAATAKDVRVHKSEGGEEKEV